MAAKKTVPADQAESQNKPALEPENHPALSEKTFTDAVKAWGYLKQRAIKDVEHWYKVGEGLLHVYNRLEADKGSTPNRNEFGKAIDASGLSDIPQTARTAAMNLVRRFGTVKEAQDTLKEIGSNAGHPEAIQKVLRKHDKAQEAAKVEDKSNAEDADYQDAEEGDGGPEAQDATRERSYREHAVAGDPGTEAEAESDADAGEAAQSKAEATGQPSQVTEPPQEHDRTPSAGSSLTEVLADLPDNPMVRAAVILTYGPPDAGDLTDLLDTHGVDRDTLSQMRDRVDRVLAEWDSREADKLEEAAEG